MKKVLLALIAGTAIAFPVFADEQIDFLHRDGGATRITFSEDSWGRTTISSESISANQRFNEELAAQCVKIIGYVIKGIYGF